jgi:thiol-disulfide isomerase/thioredoxin
MKLSCQHVKTQRKRSEVFSAMLVYGVSVLAAVCFMAVLSMGQNKDSKKQPPKLLAMGEVAPDWNLNDPAGQTHTLSEYRGKVIVMDFWATWCEPCKEIMPRMEKLYERYRDKDVVVFGINSWEQKDAVAFMQKKRFAYPLLLKGEQIADSYRVTILPSIYMIGFDGRIIYSYVGVDHQDFAELIEKYLKERATTSRSRPQ